MVIAFADAFENRYAIEGKDLQQDDGHDVIPPGLMQELQPLHFARLAAVTKPFEPAKPPPQLPNLEPAATDNKKQSHPAPAPPGKKQETTEEKTAREKKETKWAQVNGGQNKANKIQKEIDAIEKTLHDIKTGENNIAGEKQIQKGKLKQVETEVKKMQTTCEKLGADPLAKTDAAFKVALGNWFWSIMRLLRNVEVLLRGIEGKALTPEQEAEQQAEQRKKEEEYLESVLPSIKELEKRIKSVEKQLNSVETRVEAKLSTNGMIETLKDLENKLDDIDRENKALRNDAETNAMREATTAIDSVNTLATIQRDRIKDIRRRISPSTSDGGKQEHTEKEKKKKGSVLPSIKELEKRINGITEVLDSTQKKLDMKEATRGMFETLQEMETKLGDVEKERRALMQDTDTNTEEGAKTALEHISELVRVSSERIQALRKQINDRRRSLNKITHAINDLKDRIHAIDHALIIIKENIDGGQSTSQMQREVKECESKLNTIEEEVKQLHDEAAAQSMPQFEDGFETLSLMIRATRSTIKHMGLLTRDRTWY
eukprot:628824-Rhodomonas_salina.1